MTGGRLSASTLAAMVRTVDPDATLADATFVSETASTVYRLTIHDGSSTVDRMLKVTSDGSAQGLPTEARLITAVGANSDIPVPTVYGVVDDHGDLPAPFFLSSAEPGTTVPRRGLNRLSRDAIRRIARASGRHLADLHSLDAVDAYGFLEPTGEPLDGGRPTTDFAVTVGNPKRRWPEALRDWVESALDEHAESEFGDLTPLLREEFERELAALDGEFRPALARIDHGLHNLLVDPDTGRIRSVVDWGFTIAATPAYDIAHVEPELAGGPWRFHPETPNVQKLVREALLAGYRERGDDRVVDQYRSNGPLYRLLTLTRAMFLLDGALRDPSDEDRSLVVSGLRDRVRAVV